MNNLTAKQEAFAQAVASGKSQSEAYRSAYNPSRMKPESVHEKASHLMRNVKIRARVEELRAPVVAEAQMSLAGHLRDLETLRDQSVKAGKFGPAIMAEVARGRASGFYITKVEDVTDPLKKAMANMTPEKAQEMLDALDQVTAVQEKAKSAAG